MIIISKSNYYRTRVALNNGKKCYGRVSFNGLHFHFYSYTDVVLDFRIQEFIQKMKIDGISVTSNLGIFKCPTVEFLQACDVHYTKVDEKYSYCKTLKIAPLVDAVRSLSRVV